MTQVLEPVGIDLSTCSDDCPFCKEPALKNYHTKHGKLKEEKVLAKNLRSAADVTKDKKAGGNVYPLPGGCDGTTGWEADEGVFEDFTVKMAAAPHHIIPGKAAMAPSTLEKWTCESKGKIKQDIGYNIDCAQNGVFLPHLPEIYWTKYKKGTKKRQSDYYGQTWSGLSESSKQSIGFEVMRETWLQMHYTDHDDPYVHVDDEANYDDECKEACNELSDAMSLKEMQSTCKDSDGKLMPPYGLVHQINSASKEVLTRISNHPRNWTSWVSPLAQDFTQYVKRYPSSASIRGTIKRLKK